MRIYLKRAGIFVIILELCIILSLVIVSRFSKTASCLDTDEWASVYPAVGEVVAVHHDYDMVIVKTRDGNQWVFTPVDDWEIGDNVCMAMDDSGTPDDLTDDWIIAVRYFA